MLICSTIKTLTHKEKSFTDCWSDISSHKSTCSPHLGSSHLLGFMLYLYENVLFAVCTVSEFVCNGVDIVELSAPYITLRGFLFIALFIYLHLCSPKYKILESGIWDLILH